MTDEKEETTGSDAPKDETKAEAKPRAKRAPRRASKRAAKAERKPRAAAKPARSFPSRVDAPSDLEGFEGHPDYNRALAQLCADGIVNAVKASAAASKERQAEARKLLDMGAEITPPAKYLDPGVKPQPEDFITVRPDSNGDIVGVTSYGTKVRVHPDGSSTIQAGPGYDPAADVEVAAPLAVEEAKGEPAELQRVGGGVQAKNE